MIFLEKAIPLDMKEPKSVQLQKINYNAPFKPKLSERPELMCIRKGG